MNPNAWVDGVSAMGLATPGWPRKCLRPMGALLAIFLLGALVAAAPVPAQIIIPTGYTLTISPFPIHGRVTSSPGSINCGSSISPVGTVCSGNFLGTTTVTLTATPDAGYVFLGWTSSLGTYGFSPYSFTMPSSALTMAASFATVPGAPGIGTATPGNAQATIAFTAPASNGGSPIIIYVATCNPGGIMAGGTASPIAVVGLANGTAYSCSVTARNIVGPGPASGTVNVTPRTVPGAPVIGTAVPGNGQATISFSPPASNGGSPITSYQATCNPGSRSATGSASPITVTGLTSGTAYSCSVTATNVAGTGPASGVVSVTPPTVPGAPGIARAVPGNAQATISFSPPASNGGSPITSYQATCNPGGHSATGSATPITVAGLANGTTYSCSVAAMNAAGTGPASDSVSVTPLTVPGAPVIGTVRAGNGQATISFSPPASNGGSPITSYLATCNPGGIMAPGGASPITVVGLSNGTRYSCTVSATNAAGTGPPSVAANVSPEATASGGVFPMTVNSSIGTTTTVTVTIWPRTQDAGKPWNVYVFAVAPANLVRPAPMAEALAFGKALPGDEDGNKAEPVACVLAQMTSGQLQAVSVSQLQAYVSGVLSSQGQVVTILNNVPTPSVAGATFYVGYGTSPNDMIVTGVNQSVVTIPGSQLCKPQAPQTGWWWNPSEDGRGYTLEVSGNVLVMVSYLYDESGHSTWYLSAGPTSIDGSLFVGTLDYYTGGQTLTGAYKPPIRPPTSAGQVTLAFSDAHHGTLSWPGGTIAIKRMEFGVGGVNAVPLPGQPQSGWWWNAGEDGRAFFVEWQAGIAAVASYMYADSGHPIWYIGAAATPDPRVIASDWERYVNGQTLTGAYKPPVRPPTLVGPLNMRFTGPKDGILTLPDGRQVAITRFLF